MVLTRRTLSGSVLLALLLLPACTDAPAAEPTPTVTASAASEEPSASESASRPESADPGASDPATEGPSAAGPDPGTDEGPSEPGDDRQRLTGDLSGTYLPGGDAGSSGRFQGVLTPLEATVELCYDLFVDDLSSEPAGAELRYVGGEEPRAVVDLASPTDGHVEECVLIDGGEAVGLYQTPEQYEVWVFGEDHPDGALAGRLREV